MRVEILNQEDPIYVLTLFTEPLNRVPGGSFTFRTFQELKWYAR